MSQDVANTETSQDQFREIEIQLESLEHDGGGACAFYAYVGLSDVEFLVEEVRRLRKRLNEFGVYGTDECVNCETGRMTLYSRGRLCANCRDVAEQKDPRNV